MSINPYLIDILMNIEHRERLQEAALANLLDNAKVIRNPQPNLYAMLRINLANALISIAGLMMRMGAKLKERHVPPACSAG